MTTKLSSNKSIYVQRKSIMEFIQLIGVTAVIVSAIIVLAAVDKKYQLNLNATFWGHSDDWFGFNGDTKHRQIDDKDKTISELKARIEILEKIVTDPAEQLKRDINALK